MRFSIFMASIHSSEQDNAESSFGVSNYEKKVEMSEKVKENELDFAEASTEFGTFVRDFITRDLPQSAAKTFTVMKNNFTPGFISRMNQKKIHIKHVEDTEK